MSTTTLKRALWAAGTLLLSVPSGALRGQVLPPPADLRGTLAAKDLRYEGFRRYADVSVGQLALKSATVAPASPTDASAASGEFALWFFVPADVEDEPLDILVEDRIDGSYYMAPRQTSWEAGPQSFVWSDSLARARGIGLQDLLVVARFRGPDAATMIAPVALSTRARPEPVDHYTFTLVATRTVTVRYAIYGEDGTQYENGVLRSRAPNTDIVIAWDGTGMPEGRYDLVLDYLFVSGGVEEFSDVYSFHHRASFR